MTSNKLTRQALNAVTSGELPLGMLDTETIGKQREAVDQYLNSGDHRVYGFNTFLGQRDDTGATDDYQDQMLRGHLVGRTYQLDVQTLRAMTVAKLCQSQAGGSGISVAAINLAVDAFEADFPLRTGAWSDYYGAGDVVPGSWWIHSVLRGAEPSDVLRPGDLLAMMSGSFVSTGFSIEALRRLIDHVADATWALSQHVDPPHPSLTRTGNLGEEYVAFSGIDRNPVSVQKSVVFRDAEPFLQAGLNAVNVLSSAIEDRLSRPSANPWFHIEQDLCHGHYSQSSFLDVGLSSALSVAADAVRFLAAGVTATMRAPADPSETQIRIPKVAEVLIEELSAQPTARFAINESEGLEDVCDRSLARAERLRSIIGTADQLIDLYTDMHGDQGRTAGSWIFRQSLQPVPDTLRV